MDAEHLNFPNANSAKTNRYQTMKEFIAGALEYSKHPNETTVSLLRANLDVISTTVDTNIFDPGSIIAEKFYASLHSFINILDSKSPLIWSALDVLQHACRNPAARQAVIHIYKFTPTLTKLLNTNLTLEERLRVLKLLQELTYGVKIHWQEAHLSSLIWTLTQWIMQSKEEELVTLSLGVLINFCYKNLPAIYTFMRTVDTKALHKMLLKRQASNMNIRVHYCKLLIITEQTKNDIPDKIILDFVMMTFQNLLSALAQNDVLLLRHIVEFFDDVRQNEHSKSALASYSNYAQDVMKILQQLEEQMAPECASVIMEFLLSLVKLKNSSLIPLYPRYVKVALAWVPVDQVSSKALALIKTLLIDLRRSKSFADLIAELDLSVLMLVVGSEDDEMDGRYEKRSIEINSKLTELVQVLQEMSKVPDLQAQITEVFSEQTMRELLSPILGQEDVFSGNNWPGNFFQDSATALYIHALALTSDLAIQNSNWQALYSELMRKKQIQMMIALALFTGEGEVKQKSLQLMASVGFPQECVPAIAKYMSELEPLLLIQNRSSITAGVPVKTDINHHEETRPSFSLAQKDRLDALLKRLEDLCKENKISDVMTSTVMELYEIKIAAMRDAERATQASLQAADNRATSLQHRLALVSAEAGRLREMFFYSQQNYDDLQAEKAKMHAKLQNVEGESKRIHSTQTHEIQGLKKIVTEKSSQIEQLSKRIKEIEADSLRRIKELEEDNLAAEQKANELLTKNLELKKLLEKMDASLIKKRQVIETKEKEIEAAQEGISVLKQENEQYIRQCRSYAQAVSEKEDTIQKLSNELNEFSRMRDMIYQITAKKRDPNNDETT